MAHCILDPRKPNICIDRANECFAFIAQELCDQGNLVMVCLGDCVKVSYSKLSYSSYREMLFNFRRNNYINFDKGSEV